MNSQENTEVKRKQEKESASVFEEAMKQRGKAKIEILNTSTLTLFRVQLKQPSLLGITFVYYAPQDVRAMLTFSVSAGNIVLIM